MKTIIFTFLAIFLFTLFVNLRSIQAQEASACWPLVTNNIGPVVNGNINAENLKVSGVGTPVYTTTGTKFTSPPSIDINKYVQFEVSPLPDNDLLINDIYFVLSRTYLSTGVSFRYSFSSSFTPYVLISTLSPSNAAQEFRYTNMGISVPKGKTVYFRFHPYYALYPEDGFKLKDFTVSGNTTTNTPTSISYSKETWCTGEGSAEVTLNGSSGGTFASTAGLDIESSTGTINLLNSQPGNYTITYTVSGTVIASTGISVLQSPSCTISGPAGNVYKGTTHTFSAPEGMSMYSWSVSGNAVITGSTNEQTLNVTAGPTGGSSFSVSLTVKGENICTASNTKIIDVLEYEPATLPTASLSGTHFICSGSSTDLVVHLTGQAPWTFKWTDGENIFTVTETLLSDPIIRVNPTINTTYSLTGQITDGSGRTNTSTGTANVYVGPVTTAPQILACQNTTIFVPVTVKSFSQIRDISLTLKYDPAIMSYQGFENGAIAFGEGGTAGIQVRDFPYGANFRILIISATSGVNLHSLPDNAELLRLLFHYNGGNTELTWVDSPDDTWCSYSYLSPFDETGFETEAFCDLPTQTYYINGSVQQLIVSGTDIASIPDISTITGTPVTITATVAYPDMASQQVNSNVMTDLRLRYDGTGAFPAGARIYRVTCNGLSMLSSPFAIGGKNELLLSEVPGITASQLMSHSNQSDEWKIYIDGIAAPEILPASIQVLAYTEQNGGIMVLDSEAFNLTFAGSDLMVSEPAAICATEALNFTAEIHYPVINNLDAAVKADARITATHAFPAGTLVEWNYNSISGGSYSLPGSLNEILLSTVIGADPSTLQGHSGTDVWTFTISNAGLMTANDVSIEAVALLEGDYYVHSRESFLLTIRPVPELSDVSLLSSVDESAWTPVNGELLSGYHFCADPAETYHYFDIASLTTPVALSSNFENNGFYLDINSLPGGFYEYWNAKGVNESSSGGWQDAMWKIISGDQPMFYISYSEDGYQLIDGLQYQYESVTGHLRISGDYPAGSYVFNGSVTGNNGCSSDPISVILNVSSAPVISCPADITIETDEGECGAVAGFTVAASGSPVPEINYTLTDGTTVEPGHFFPVGNTEVIATASNVCKTVSCRFNVVVTDNTAPVLTCPVSGNLDVKLNNIDFYRHSGTGWDAAASDNCSVKNVSYTLSGATTGSGVTLDGTTFNLGTTTVTWQAMDDADNLDELFYTVTVTGIGLTGTVKYYNNDETPLDNATVTLIETGTGAVAATATTDLEGAYSFSRICPGIYEIAIATNKPMRSINSTDAGQVNAWNVAQSGEVWPSIGKVRFLSGDVNSDNYVNSGDAGMIQNYFLTLGTEVLFDKPWEFWKKNVQVSVQPQTDNILFVELQEENNVQDFYGLVSGDFNRSNVPSHNTINSLIMKSAKINENMVTLIKGDTITAGTDDVIEVPVRTVSEIEVGAISLILDFPSEKIQVQDVFIKNNPNRRAGFNVMDDMLIIGWNSVDPVPLKANEPLVTLKLKILKDNGNIPVFFELNDSPLNELADEYMIGISNTRLIMDGILMKETITHSAGTDDMDLKLSCYPNPFENKVTIEYILPTDGEVNLYISGTSGNKMNIITLPLKSAGKHQFVYNEETLIPGVYHITLLFKDKQGIQKMKTNTLVKQ